MVLTVPSVLPIAHTWSQRSVPGEPVSMQETAFEQPVETVSERLRNTFTLPEPSISDSTAAVVVAVVVEATSIFTPERKPLAGGVRVIPPAVKDGADTGPPKVAAMVERVNFSAVPM